MCVYCSYNNVISFTPHDNYLLSGLTNVFSFIGKFPFHVLFLYRKTGKPRVSFLSCKWKNDLIFQIITMHTFKAINC